MAAYRLPIEGPQREEAAWDLILGAAVDLLSTDAPWTLKAQARDVAAYYIRRFMRDGRDWEATPDSERRYAAAQHVADEAVRACARRAGWYCD